ncbi:hypothetical protein LU631_19485 [Erwinia tracheiphila]|nr:hypothetical protein [Erwinia tracheiphila]UIA84646.1 hypothetical protein LU604_06775 [Erwinia tracheiphila]UIA86973.1 hypothetical protein LU631_19485 [Erwinia tracheiphila]UIA93239.1 hypothetical protein LU632_06760 [Erwinia tracheiphila]UIA95330.1 hypothetical protein LU633_17940 [Erwinia tracheiphila]
MKLDHGYLNALCVLYQQETHPYRLSGLVYLSPAQRKAILKSLLQPFED